mmetsp:Transcript_48404/g.121189  ORF Transcript_48404/g.121189 Transcript_48404/m.121189 type:complete len:93 (-) Transcript_48404:1265-1543(-)
MSRFDSSVLGIGGSVLLDLFARAFTSSDALRLRGRRGRPPRLLPSELFCDWKEMDWRLVLVFAFFQRSTEALEELVWESSLRRVPSKGMSVR